MSRVEEMQTPDPEIQFGPIPEGTECDGASSATVNDVSSVTESPIKGSGDAPLLIDLREE